MDDDVINYDEMQDIRKSLIFDILLKEQGVDTESDDAFDVNSIAVLRLGELRLEISRDLNKANDRVKKEFDLIEDKSDEFDSDKIKDVKELVQKAEKASEVSGKVIEYFTLLSSLVEEITISILLEEIISEEYVEFTSSKKLFQRNMTQESREELLLRTGTIDEGLKGELKRIRSTRNELLHNTNKSILLNDLENIVSELDRASKTLTKLRKIESDGKLVGQDLTIEYE